MLKRSAALAAASAVLLASGAARAVEKEHHIGIGGGLSLLSIDDKSSMDVGAGARVFYTYGLTDQFNLLVEGGSSVVALGEKGGGDTPRTRPSLVSSLGVGASYVLDIVQWIPYGGVLVGGDVLTGGTIDGASVLPSAQIALGLDYKYSRRFSVGLAIRQHMFVTKLSTYPSYTNAFVRFEYAWGF